MILTGRWFPGTPRRQDYGGVGVIRHGALYDGWGVRGLRDLMSRSAQRALASGVRTGEFQEWLPGVTFLARENQHEAAVAARKFGNLMLFGCWWFVNNPSLIDEITRMRVELLGTSFIPQHSDARVLDQLIYKWDHSRKIVAKVLTDKFAETSVRLDPSSIRCRTTSRRAAGGSAAYAGRTCSAKSRQP